MSKSRARLVQDKYIWGMWVWEKPNGQYVADDDGNLMNVFSTKDNRESVRALAEAAAHYGFPDGKAVFLPGHRPVDDEEYEYQLARHKWGLIPDEFDVGALNDEIEARRAQK